MSKTLLKGKIAPKHILILALLVLSFLFPQIITQPYFIQIAITVLIYCYWSSAWNIIGGYAGQFALGNGVYIGIGAYVAVLFHQEGFGSPWIGMVLGGVISVMFAFIISKPCFKLRGTYFSLATVAFLHIVRYIILGFNSIFGMETNGGMGIMIPYTGRWQDMQFGKEGFYYVILVMLVLILVVSNAIRTSKMGYYLSAIKTNQGAASTIGINVPKYKMMAQCISAFCLALGGAVYVHFLLNVSPYDVFGYDLSLEIMIYCVIGGSGTLWGPVFGAFVLGIVNETLRVQLGSDIAPLASALYGVALILIVRFAPGGLYQLGQMLINKIKGSLGKKKSETKEVSVQ